MKYFVSYRAWDEHNMEYHGRLQVEREEKIRDHADILGLEKVISAQSSHDYEQVIIQNWRPFEDGE